MKKIFIWGAGTFSYLLYSVIDKTKCQIGGIVDSDVSKQGMEWKTDIYIHSPQILLQSEYDYIVISPYKYESIKERCIEMNILLRKIVIFCDKKSQEQNDIFISPYEMAVLINKYEKHIENMPYELEIENIPQIKNADELLRIVLEEKCSVSRFGDGEFEMMFERNRPWFQKVDSKLAKRLQQILLSDNSSIKIAIAKNFGSLDCYTAAAADGIRDYMSLETRKNIMKYIDMSKTYYDAYVSRPYIIYKDKAHATKIFTLYKQIFKNRNIVIVEGCLSRVGIKNDLFSTSKSIRRIECPAMNAWEKYNEIMKCVKNNYREDDLICISMGPTATVLAYDLGKLGMQSLDIGQLDNEYEWYIKNVKERIDIPGKMVAEVKNDLCVNKLEDIEYEKQIVKCIS